MFVEANYPQWLKDFNLSEFIETRCILHDQPCVIHLHRPVQKIKPPKLPGVYFIFASYYTPENREVSLEMLTEEYTELLMQHLGFQSPKEFFQSGILRTGLIEYPQMIEKTKGLLYIGSTSDFSKRVKLTHHIIKAIRRNALAMPYPYGAELRVQVKLLQLDLSINRIVLTAIEREFINRMKPPLNDFDFSLMYSDDPFLYCDHLERVQPLQLFPSELSMAYIKNLLRDSEKAVKDRMAGNLKVEYIYDPTVPRYPPDMEVLPVRYFRKAR